MKEQKKTIFPLYKNGSKLEGQPEHCFLLKWRNKKHHDFVSDDQRRAHAVLSRVIITVCIFLQSCAVPRYMHVYESAKGLDLSGQWLINNIDTDSYIEQTIKEKIYKGFIEMGVDSIQSIDKVNFEYITPDHFHFNLSEETLSLLKKTTGYDYIISIDVMRIKDELSEIMIFSPERESSSISEVIFTVHDINRMKKIYHQRIIATVTIDEDDDDTFLAKSSTGLIYGAIKHGLKEVRKYSVVSR